MSQPEAENLEVAEAIPAADPEILPEPDQEPDHHEAVVAEPAYAPPPMPAFPRGWVPAVSLLGSILCGGTMMAINAQQHPLHTQAMLPQPGDTVATEGPSLEQMAMRPMMLELAGPPKPEPAPNAPNAITSAAGMTANYSARPVTGRRGAIGFIGSISGPLNTDLSGVGVVRGPVWRGMPLPNVSGMPPLAQLPSAPAPAGPPVAGVPQPIVPAAPSVPDASSELPDTGKLALARLANPLQGGVKPVGAEQPARAEASAEKPLSIGLSVARPVRGYEPGATVAVRVSANTDAYFALIGVNGEGHASTLFRSSSPARSMAIVVRAQTAAGPQYVVAVGSVNPITGGDAAAALRSSGQGFVAPTMTIAHGGGQPGAAWGAAISQAASLGGGAKGWKRHEWAVSSGSFFTRAPAKVAVERPAPEKPVAPKTVATPDSSVVPTPKPEMTPEKSVMPPTPKPEPAQPKSPMTVPEPAKTQPPPVKPEAPAEKSDAPGG